MGWESIYNGKGGISWVGGRYSMDRGVIIPWVVGSKYHG